MMPRLPNELVVHINPVSLQVPPSSRQLFVRQGWRMILLKNIYLNKKLPTSITKNVNT